MERDDKTIIPLSQYGAKDVAVIMDATLSGPIPEGTKFELRTLDGKPVVVRRIELRRVAPQRMKILWEGLPTIDCRLHIDAPGDHGLHLVTAKVAFGPTGITWN